MESWLAKWRLAWRDLRAQGRRSVFFALLVAAGVASLVGVQGAAGSLASAMHTSAKQLMQGDLVISHTQELTAAQQAALDGLRQDGAVLTTTWQTRAMAIAGKGWSLVEVKVVDPQVWPFYGGFASSPPDQKPAANEALVGPELLTRLNLQVGGTVQVGESRLKIVGTVVQEPRSPDGQIPLGPRVLVSPAGFRAPTSADTQNILVKLPVTVRALDAKGRLQALFPGENGVQTTEEAWQSFASVMDKVFTFLSMVALISLLVGGLGVAMAMRTFISQKLEHIAVLKALGATSRSVMTVFLIEAALLGVGGSLAGVCLGLGVQVLLPKLLADLIPVAAVGLDWAAAASGLAAGVVIAVLCALIPVRAVRNVKPVALFRGESTAAQMGWKAWLEAVIVGLLTLGGVTWVAMLYAKSTGVGLGFIGGLIGAALLLFLLTWVLLRATRLLPQSGRPAIRHAVRSLRAPGNQSAAIVVAMGLGIMLMTTVYLLQHSLMDQVRSVGAGPETPNVYVMSVSGENRNAVRSYLEHNPQVSKVPAPLSMVTTMILAADGTRLSQRNVPASFKNPFPVVTSAKELPHGMKVLQGEWFTPEDAGKPLLTVQKQTADILGLKPGSQVELLLKNQQVTFTVKSIIGQSGNGVVTNMGPLAGAPGSLDAYAESYVLTAVTKPHQEDAVVSDVLQKYPGVMPISLSMLLNIMDDVLAKVANILRFVTGFAVIAAGVILSGSLSATQLRRRKEAALLKSLGATRGTVAAASALENGLLGAVAGLAGGGLGYAMIGAAAMGLKMAIGASGWPLVVVTVAGALLAVLVGIAATVDVLRVKPLGILRSE